MTGADSVRVVLVGAVEEMGGLRDRFERAPGMQVVAGACTPAEALEAVRRHRPQVLCIRVGKLGTELVTLVRKLMAESPLPVLLLGGYQPGHSAVFQLLQEGALDVIAEDVAAAAVAARIRVLAGVRIFRRRIQAVPSVLRAAPRGEAPRLVAVGASTGGPQALCQILSGLDAEFPVPIVCVQHIGAGFLQDLVEWLGGRSRLQVKIAVDAETLCPGTAYFAPEHRHLRVDSAGRIRLDGGARVDGHRPSATVLFQSAAESYAGAAIGILLTGMGGDGAQGLRDLAAAGGQALVQDQASSAVFGMAERALELGTPARILALEQIAPALLSLTNGIREGRRQ